jgi:hypothetical protein
MEKGDRRTLSVNAVAYEYLKLIQIDLERKIGFKPSMSQVIVYLASKMEQDKLTGEQNV